MRLFIESALVCLENFFSHSMARVSVDHFRASNAYIDMALEA